MRTQHTWSIALLTILVASIVSIQVWIKKSNLPNQSIPPQYVVNISEELITPIPIVDLAGAREVWTRINDIFEKPTTDLTFTAHYAANNLAYIMSFYNLNPDRPDDLTVRYRQLYNVWLDKKANMTIRGTNKTEQCEAHVDRACNLDKRFNEAKACKRQANLTHYISMDWSAPDATVFKDVALSRLDFCVFLFDFQNSH